MSLLYAIAAIDNDCILADATNPTIGVGNYQALTKTLLKKLKRNVTLCVPYDENYQFNYINEQTYSGNFTFLCLTESSFPKRLTFSYLRDIRENYIRNYSSQTSHTAYSLQQTQFQAYLVERMQFYNNPQSDKLRELQKNAQDVKNIMIENIDKILERGEKIDILVEKTETMAVQSTLLKKQAREVRRIMWWRNWKINCLIAIGVCIVIWLIVSFCCGFDFHRCR